MSDKTPMAYSLIDYAGVLGLAVWGGLVNFRARVKAGKVPAFSIMELVGEMATSGFVGVITFFVCEATGVHPLITAATVGMAGHMGGRSLTLLEEYLINRFKRHGV